LVRFVIGFLRAFSEATIKSAQPIEVRQISTSDPLFFFGLDPVTVATVGTVFTWALSQWKKVEEIRKLRSETKKNTAFDEDDIKQFFDTKIEKTIKSAIDEKVAELIGDGKTTGRTHEQRTDLEWALRSILARIERGMIVEVRFLPAPGQEGDTRAQEKEQAFATLKEVAPALVFPAIDQSPVLELPPPEPEKTTKPSGKKSES
jgi:hypothetical protein